MKPDEQLETPPTTPATVDPAPAERQPGQHGKQPRRGRRRMLRPQNATASSVAQLERVSRCKLALATRREADLRLAKCEQVWRLSDLAGRCLDEIEKRDLSLEKTMDLCRMIAIALHTVHEHLTKPLPPLHAHFDFGAIANLQEASAAREREIARLEAEIAADKAALTPPAVIDVPAESADGAETLAAGSESAETQAKADRTDTKA